MKVSQYPPQKRKSFSNYTHILPSLLLLMLVAATTTASNCHGAIIDNTTIKSTDPAVLLATAATAASSQQHLALNHDTSNKDSTDTNNISNMSSTSSNNTQQGYGGRIKRQRRRSNILFILTDDEDTVMGGDSLAAMPKGLPRLAKRGLNLTNWFVHTPVCACSRAEILTGRYFHNLADTDLAPGDPWDQKGNTGGPCFPDRKGGGCRPASTAPGRNMHLNFTKLSPGPTVFQHLALAGYRVAVHGKYLNRVPVHPSGRPQIPAGVDTSGWFVSPGDEANKASRLDRSGEYYPSFYYDGEGVWNNTDMQYETAFLGNRSVEWIRNVTLTAPGTPWFLYLAPHAPHGMSIPAPWYANLRISARAPRDPSWNFSATDHHWLVAQQQPITTQEARRYDVEFANRWRCLRAVDDMVDALLTELVTLGIDNNTYVFFSSDHGYHMAQLRLPAGKWNVYDTDIRVPMYISGPGIPSGGKQHGFVGSHVDLAPTWLGLAGTSAPTDEMDGRNLVYALVSIMGVGDGGVIDEDKEEKRLGLGSVIGLEERGRGGSRGGGRLSLGFSHHHHRRRQDNFIAPQKTNQGGGGVGGALPLGGAYVEYHGLGLTGSPGRLGDAFNNTYRALRVIDRRTGGEGGLGNVLYAEFGSYTFDSIMKREYYNLDTDPHQMYNKFATLTPEEQASWAARILRLWKCRGAACGQAVGELNV